MAQTRLRGFVFKGIHLRLVAFSVVKGNQPREDIVIGIGNDALLTFIRNGDGTLVPLSSTLKADDALRVNPLRVYA